MKKFITGIGIMSVVLWVGSSSLAADKVVVIPLNSSSNSSLSIEQVDHMYSIPGTSFQVIREYGQTEGNGYEVTRRNPGLFIIGAVPYGVAHNKDGGKMSFTAPVHLPDGASVGHIGAAVCSGDPSVTDHNIGLALMKTDMTTGTQEVVRSYTITSTNCGTSQGGSGLMIVETVDNSKYAYEFMVSGIEGGTCSITDGGFLWTCDDRRTRLQFAHVSYSTSEVVQP